MSTPVVTTASKVDVTSSNGSTLSNGSKLGSPVDPREMASVIPAALHPSNDHVFKVFNFFTRKR